MSKILKLTENSHNAIIERQLLAEGILNDILNGIAQFISQLFSKENVDKAKELGQQGAEWAKETFQDIVTKVVEDYLPVLAKGALKPIIKEMAKENIPFTEANLKIALRDNIKAVAQTAVKAGGILELLMSGGLPITKLIASVIVGKAAGKNETLVSMYNEIIMSAVNRRVYPYILEDVMTFEEMKAFYGGDQDQEQDDIELGEPLDQDDIELGEPLNSQSQDLNEAKIYQRWQKIAGIIKG